MNKSTGLWLVIGLIGYCVLPWYVLEDGFWGWEWLIDGYPFDTDYAPAIFLLFQGEKLWLSPLIIFLLLPLVGRFPSANPPPNRHANILLIAGIAGLCWLAIQGFGIGLRGWNFDAFTQLSLIHI